MANFLHFGKSVPLPLEFINKYMISANATYVKVYLYGLAKCYEGDSDVSNEEIAQALDILETDVSKAWRYWKRVGLVHSEGKGVLVFDPMPAQTVKEETSTNEKEAVKETSKTTSIKEISKTMGINPKMKETVRMAEQLLKKPLTQREITSLYTFMQEYSMTQEMVLVLLEYCVTLDKTNFSYIEKVAHGWNEQGVTTLREATKVLNRLTKEMNMIKKCKKTFGLDREFSQTEKNYISHWVSELSMSEAMIKNAYERTITNTGKLSMPYMNTILKSWFEKGIKTVSQIAEKETAPAPKGKGKNSGYQLDEMAALERKLRLQKQKN
ncbi:MAG: DnaD domain protein [Clostridia bacterium]|nr:DnaD domain protein [Clostridia bacterium]